MTFELRDKSAPDNVEAKSGEPAGILFDDARTGRTIGGFERLGRRGQACSADADAERVPTLLPGQFQLRDCQMKGRAEVYPGMKEVDFPNIYRQVANHAARIDQSIVLRENDEDTPIKEDGPQGSGVIVGRDKNKCLILTADHVVTSKPEREVVDTTVVLANGKRYPAQTRFTDAGNDLAVISINTGADTSKLCRPIELAPDNAGRRWQPVASFGFPDSSRAMYVSLGAVLKKDNISNILNEEEMRTFKREPTQALLMNAPLLGGMSGGPTVDERGRLMGINQLGEQASSVAGRITRPVLERMLASARRK